MSRADVMEKARDLIAPVLGCETSGRLIETVQANRNRHKRSQAAAAAAARLTFSPRAGPMTT
jgi:hypothetical protein